MPALISPGVSSRARCGETLEGRVDMRNELSHRDDAAGFFVRKRMIGSKRCFNPIDVVLYFDANRRLESRQIEGGTFISAEEHETDESTASDARG